jgi:Fe-S oxidoreductase
MSGLGSVASRPVFWDFTVGLRVLWYVLAVASIAVFAYGVARPLLRYRRAAGGPWPPVRPSVFARRLGRAASQLVRGPRIGRRDRPAGRAHGLIFYGFVVLFIGTVVLGFDTDFTKPVFGWDYFHGGFYLVYKEVLNVFGTALLVGVIFMMVRRSRDPAKLRYTAAHGRGAPSRPYRTGDWAFVSILLAIVVTGFLLEGVRIAMDAPGYAGTQFAGWLVAQALTGVGDPTLAGLRHGLWWFHGLLAISFVASIPYTKAAHMLSGTVSLALRDPDAKTALPVIKVEGAEAAGYATARDFSPKHLIQLDACTRCGKCHEACPANATGLPLSPRDLILNLHEQSLHGGDGVKLVGPDGVAPETIWSCMQCNACVEICPVGIEQAPIINLMRRALIEDGEIDPRLQSTMETIHKSGNSFGENRRRRGRWTQELEFEVKDARKEPVDILWFVGDYASFDPRSQTVSQALARLFARAGVDFGLLYDGEWNSGNDVRRVGEEGLFELLAEHNVGVLEECDFSRIMTSDPHSLNTLRNEYPALGGRWPVIHHTAVLAELLEAGALPVRPLGYRVTYHDPCHLGRMNGEFDDPRRVLELLGCTLVEMPRNRDNSFCCGAGGGRIWIPDAPGTERPSENRIREATALPDVELFVVSCPKDVTMYEDAIKTSGNGDRIALREICELVEEALVEAEVPAPA